MSTAHIHNDLSFLQELKQRGITLRAEEEGLVCKAKPGALTPELRKRITKAKPRLLSLLSRMAPEEEFPPLRANPEARHLPFPLTENQEAYWLGRGSEQDSGSVGIHVFFEVQIANFDLHRFTTAWQEVVRRHDMLRAVVLGDGTQVIQECSPTFTIQEHKLFTGDYDKWNQQLEYSRQRLAHQCYNLAEWPQFSFAVFQHGNDALLMGSVDCWALDGRSLQILFNDLAAIYKGKELEDLPEVNFRDYVLHLETIRTLPQYQKSWEYWKERIKSLPLAPKLPTAEARSRQQPNFSRKSAQLSSEQWKSLREEARKRELTLASLLLACYAETLSRWAEEKHFTINVPRWNRLPVHSRINDIAGEFASFSLMEVNRRKPLPFKEHARAVQQQVLEDLKHGLVSGVKVLREWRKVLGLTPGTLVPYVFTSEPETETGEAGSWVSSLEQLGRVKRTLTQTPQVWIDSQYAVVDDQLFLFWDVDESMFPNGLPDKMFTAYVDLVRNLAGATDSWESISPIPLPFEEQSRRRTLTGEKVPIDPTLPWEHLKHHARHSPDANALTDRDGSLSWKQFKEEVLFWQKSLARLGVTQGTPVALALRKGRLQSIASMAVHSLGGVLIPMDYNLPQARAMFILQNSGARLLLTDGATQIQPGEIDGLALNMAARQNEQISTKDFPLNEHPLDPSLYCVIYTSGSTGTPKGVMVPIRGILNMAQHTLKRFGLGFGDAVLSLSPFHHDLALFDIVGGILAGMHTVFPDPDHLRDPAYWAIYLKEKDITVWNTVPAMMTMLLDYLDSNTGVGQLPNLRYSILGGDWIPASTPPRLKAYAPECTVISSGGPTETTGWNILYPIKKYDPSWKSIPYGRPIQNVTYHVWDCHMQDCPELVAGELFCSGEGITAGYLNDEEKTCKAYIMHPETCVPMFRTGDLGRLTSQGNIEFIGRRDHQVNLNGYRIELGEIEATLARHPLINQVVASIYSGAGGSGFIGMWCTCIPGETIPREEELKTYLEKLLPRHMRPRFIGIAEQFPLNKNNKIDRNTIAKWNIRHETSGAEPKTATQKHVAAVWKEVLGQASLHIDQNFFELGGDSISAVRLYTMLLAEDYPGLHVSTIFSNPTINSLARVMDDHRQNSDTVCRLPAIKRYNSSTHTPATRAQHRLWFENQNPRNHAHHVLHFTLKVTGNVSIKKLQHALETVVSHHEALQTRLLLKGDVLLQEIVTNAKIQLAVEDLRLEAPHKAQVILEGLCQSNALRPISMEDAPMGRASLVLLNDSEARLLLAFHHAVFDGWSMGIFLADLKNALEAKKLTRAHFTQADLAFWEQEEETIRAIQVSIEASKKEFSATKTNTTFWPDKNQLSRSALPTYGNVTLKLSQYMVSSLTKLAAKAEVTVFSALCTLFGLTLARHTNSKEVQIGTYASTRTMPGLDTMLGMLVNPVPLNLEYDTATTIYDTLKANGKTIARAQEKATIPFDILVQELAPCRNAEEHPLFTIAFSQDNSPSQTYEGGGMQLQPLSGRQHGTALDLEVSLLQQNDSSLLLNATFNNSRFSIQSIDDLLGRFCFIAEQAAQNHHCELAALQLMTPQDRLLQSRWNNTSQEFKCKTDLLAPFLKLTANVPEQRPICGQSLLGDSCPTYKELFKCVQGLMRILKQNGVKQGDFVGIHLSPGIDTVIAMLACWGCSAAFLPLDIKLPQTRLYHHAQTARTRLIVTEDRYASIWNGHEFQILSLESIRIDTLFTAKSSGTFELVQNCADTVACLYFTSGSSGTPKGVLLSHANLLNRIQWLWQAVPKEHGELWCAKASFSFVDSLCEYLGPLLSGGDLYICTSNEAADPETLLKTIARKGVTRLTLVPTLLAALLDIQERNPQDLSTLRHLTASGEQLSGELARRCYTVLPHVTLYNLYGSTEVTADATWHVVSPEAEEAIPIGKPIANTAVTILDNQRRELPHGIPGEICISGASTALGYLNPKDNGFFIQDGKTCFATGDVGMWTRDGELLYLGRIDRQLKIRGQRVEPAETEKALKLLAPVRDAVVFGIGQTNDTRLACAIVPAQGKKLSPEDLRTLLLPGLPPAMIPSFFLNVEVIPLTASGKVDINALQKLSEQPPQNSTEPIRDEIGQRLALLWENLLGKAPTSANADFFASGGHSLLATRLAARIREQFNIPFKTNQIFERPVLKDMASTIDLLAFNTHEQQHAEKQCREVEEF